LVAGCLSTLFPPTTARGCGLAPPFPHYVNIQPPSNGNKTKSYSCLSQFLIHPDYSHLFIYVGERILYSGFLYQCKSHTFIHPHTTPCWAHTKTFNGTLRFYRKAWPRFKPQQSVLQIRGKIHAIGAPNMSNTLNPCNFGITIILLGYSTHAKSCFWGKSHQPLTWYNRIGANFFEYSQIRCVCVLIVFLLISSFLIKYWQISNQTAGLQTLTP